MKDNLKPVFKKTILKNGIRVVTEHHPFCRSVCSSIYVQLGSRDEPKDLKGAAHFIEHMVFKGTKKRTAFEIAKSLESVGGEINAYTSRELTCFHTVSLSEDLEESIDVLIDLVSSAKFRKNDFLTERKVILQEIQMSADVLEEYIFDCYFERYFKGHSLGSPILGSEKSLLNTSWDNLKKYYSDNYQGKNLIVSVAGNVDHETVVKMINKKFENKKLKHSQKRKAPSPKGFVEVVPKPSEQTHILMGLPSESYNSDLRFESYIVNACLGGGMTSRLYQRIREELGLVYTIYSYLHSFTDNGILAVYAGASKENAPQVIDNIFNEIKNVIKNGISKSELDFFKKQVKCSILLGSDDIESRMNSIAINEMIFNEYRSVESVIKEIDKVSLKSIKEYIHSNFKIDKMGIYLMGDVDKLEGQSWISKNL